MLGVGAKKKTYLDDVFSSYVYTGTGSTRSINTSVDMSKGGLVWIKDRENGVDHNLYDTERGVGKYVSSNLSDVEDTSSPRLNAFNSNGFGLGGNSTVNGSGTDFASWSFRKAPGFFDVKTFSGHSSNFVTVNHDLGSEPGLVMFKKTSGAEDWFVWHRDIHVNSHLLLNTTAAIVNNQGYISNQNATSCRFYVTTNTSDTYVAYLFAGGESTNALARSVDISGGAGNYLNVQSTSSDLEMGSSDFTLELWINSDGVTTANRNFFSLGNPVQFQHNVTNNVIWFSIKDTSNSTMATATSPSIGDGQWHHLAVTRSGNTFRAFLDGIQYYTTTSSGTVGGLDGNYPSIGSYNSGSNAYGFNGKISNLRFVKGTAVYTSSFRPPTEPLTNITNTKLLCCNNSSVTGYTVSPAALAASGSGNPAASTDSPFDDPAGFVFGDAGDQNVIKCGSYKGESSHSTRLEVNLGFEPQWVLIKNVDSTKDWVMLDSMRRWEGNADDQNVSWLEANSSGGEANGQMAAITPTGFICQSSSFVNGNSDDFIYMAIRRPDPLVQKPQLATDVFAMDKGNSSETIPVWDSGFPVDFAIKKTYASSASWYVSSRLTQGRYLLTDDTGAMAGGDGLYFDSNEGYGRKGNTYSWGTNKMAWMWKRHAGFDVVTYKGNAVTGRQIRHSLSKTPEMMWIKDRSASAGWIVFHKGLGGGTNPSHKYLQLNNANAEADTALPFVDTEPTSTNFTVGSWGLVNNTNHHYLAMLFASVDGISKVGYYSGSGSNPRTITLGFAPRFLFIKNISTSNTPWLMLDTVRGFETSGSPDGKRLMFHESTAEQPMNIVWRDSNGFILNSDYNWINASGNNYIYYAHA